MTKVMFMILHVNIQTYSRGDTELQTKYKFIITHAGAMATEIR